MKKEKRVSLLTVFVLAVCLQTYMQHSDSFTKILSDNVAFFLPLIWTLFLSILMYPLQLWIEKKWKLRHKVLSLGLVLLFLFAVVTSFFLLVVPQLSKSIRELREIYPFIVDKLQEYSDTTIQFLNKKGLLMMDSQELGKAVGEYLHQNAAKMQQIGLSIFLNIFSATMGIGNFFMGLFLACLVLLEPDTFVSVIREALSWGFGKERTLKHLEILKKSQEIFINYFVGRLVVSFFVGLTVFVILFFSGTPYPVLSAVMFGLGNMIPYVGSIVASIISGILILIFAPYKILYLILAIFVAQMLDGFVIGPKIVGDKVGLNSFWVMISMVLCGKLMGIAGMFLGVPIFSIIKMIYGEKKKEEEQEEESKAKEEEGNVEDSSH